MGKNMLLGVLAAAMLALAPGRAAEEITDAPLNIEGRGTVQMNGIINGFTNLIVKPFGGWAAQDYCMKDMKRAQENGATVLRGVYNTRPGARFEERVTTVNDPADKRKIHQIRYKLTPLAGGNFSYESIFVKIPLGIKSFLGGKVVVDGKEFDLPPVPGGAVKYPEAMSTLAIEGAAVKFLLKAEGMKFSLVDERHNSNPSQSLLITATALACKDKPAYEFGFDVKCAMQPYFIREDGKTWVAFPRGDMVPADGGIFDFSDLVDAPAGKYGRIISKDGHFAYEKTGKRVKLIGTNLCYSANYLTKENADKLAQIFRKMGYNTIRLHHTDVHMRKGSWSARRSDDIDEGMLDRLDYLFAKLKENGMYMSIDFYTQRNFDKGEIEGVDRMIGGEIKGYVPIHEPAFEAWKKLVVKWMNHVNPYTNIAWKDDPALIFACPLNEDSIASVWWSAKDLYLKKFEEWKKEKNIQGKEGDVSRDPAFAQFLTEVKMASNEKITKFLKEELGLKCMLSGSNWWNLKTQAFTREQLDVVDNHQYADHPQGPCPRMPLKYNQESMLRCGNLTYAIPLMMAPNRIYGKPFTVTEYNFCGPNQFRAAAGAMMGAYASLQDWDGLYRFAWAHGDDMAVNPIAWSHFDIANDPIGLLTERQIILMFRRGDVSAANKRFVYGMTMKDAASGGVGGMWGGHGELFPDKFNAQGALSQVGSQVIEGGKAVRGRFTGVVAPEKPGEAVLAGNPYVPLADLPAVKSPITSDTGETTWDNRKGTIAVVTPKTECLVAPAGVDMSGKTLAVKGLTTFTSVSASAMDGGQLADSSRVLVLHLTNALDTESKFTTSSMTTMLAWGKLPLLAYTGKAEVTLKNANAGMKLYAVGLDGKRVGEVPAEYEDGAYKFTAEVSAARPVMAYELAAE